MGFFQNTCKPQGLGGKMMVNIMNNGHAKLSEWGFSHVDVPADANVLDVGCGGGANIAVWLTRCPNGIVTGLDYSEVSVSESIKYNKKAIQEKRCQILQGNVAQMPFDDNSFDYISAFETIYFWPGLERCFKEVNRVLKPHAKFIIVVEVDGTKEKDKKWSDIVEGMVIYKENELVANLETAGFTNIRTDHNEKQQMCVIAEKK